MWNLTKESKDKFSSYHTMPIHETDEDWEYTLSDAKEGGLNITAQLKEELDEVKEKLLAILPSRFIPYVENGTLNQPTLPETVRNDYLQWMREGEKEFEQLLDAAYENTRQSVTFLSSEVQDVFAESLHDSTIDRIVREGDTLHLYVNTDGGFSSKSLIHFTFQHVLSEISDTPLQVGQWFIYYEMQKTDNGFAFRVLFECPDAEWTIVMKKLDAEYFYRPAIFTKLRDEEKLEEISLAEYVPLLNTDYRYWFITPDVTCVIKDFSETAMKFEDGKIEIGQSEVVLTVGNERFSYNLGEYNPIQFIYTDVYEDPYAQQNEPMPMEQLEAAALSDDLELQVRAWNTMYSNPIELATIINQVLAKMEITEENEMIVHVYSNHFYKEGILTEDVIEKYRELLE